LNTTALHASMVACSLQEPRRPTSAACSACRSLSPGVKISQLLEGIGAEYIVVGFAKLWGLPVSEELVETVTGEI
jgi:hypothetical protein